MALQRFYLLGFLEETSWELVENGRLAPAEAPQKNNCEPIVALLPDDLFYFTPAPGGRGSRAGKATVRLYMQHSLPELLPEQHQGVVKIPGGVLGFRSHPGLAAFLAEHRAELEGVSALYPESLLAVTAAHSEKLTRWTWTSRHGITVAASEKGLHFFRSDGQEADARLEAMDARDEARALTREDIYEILFRHNVRPARLHMPIKGLHSRTRTITGLSAKAVAAVAAMALLLCLGQAVRLYKANATAGPLQETLNAQYASVLGNDLGKDPFGRLLSRLEQAKHTKAQGLDLLQLLAALSKHAPKGFLLDEFNLTVSGGTLQGRIGSYEGLDGLIAALSTDEAFTFTLDKAESAAKMVTFNLSVRQR